MPGRDVVRVEWIGVHVVERPYDPGPRGAVHELEWRSNGRAVLGGADDREKAIVDDDALAFGDGQRRDRRVLEAIGGHGGRGPEPLARLREEDALAGHRGERTIRTQEGEPFVNGKTRNA